MVLSVQKSTLPTAKASLWYLISLPDSSVQREWEEVHAYSLFLLPLPLLSVALYSPHLSFLFYFLTVNLLPPKLLLCKTPVLYIIFLMHLSLSLCSILMSTSPSLPPTPPVLNFYLTLVGVSMQTGWWSVKSSAVLAVFLVSLFCRPLTMPLLPVTWPQTFWWEM